MEVIVGSKTILLNEGYNEFEINTDETTKLFFQAKTDASVFIRIVNATDVHIETTCEENVSVAYLFWNVSEKEIHIDEDHTVAKDGNLTIAYGECNSASSFRKTHVALKEQGAQALVSSASLVQDKKNFNIDVVNEAPHTYGDMKNYAVVLKTGSLMIDAIGRILKGAYRSESHQTSRALSFEEGQRSTILPELLIDENDVQASHAMSIGRVDEEQLYYMMSRGLSIQQCTSLISTGYLMPITEVINNDELKQTLQKEMERKIGELCSM